MSQAGICHLNLAPHIGSHLIQLLVGLLISADLLFVFNCH